MFEFIDSLTSEDFHQNVEFLIEGFLPKKQITVIYADGGNGKSWLATALSKYAARYHAMNVVYIDIDNGMNTLIERGIEEKLLQPCPDVTYAHRSKLKLEPTPLLEQIEQKAVGTRYAQTLFVLDSLQDFVAVKNDDAVTKLFDKLKNIREAGATILVLHHSNKNGVNYEGSNKIKNSTDNMYRLVKADSPEGEIHWLMELKKDRAAITDVAYKVDVEDLSLMQIDIESVKLDDETKAFIENIKTALAQGPMNKTNLLKAVGSKKDDKTARNRLDKFEGIHWQSSKKGSVVSYTLVK
jgi:archaellum biogenesis ATPase FlaH